MKLHGKRTKQALAFYLERQKLRQEIEQTRHSIDSARNHFEQVVDPTLIDCYIYELNAGTAALPVPSAPFQKSGAWFHIIYDSLEDLAYGYLV